MVASALPRSTNLASLCDEFTNSRFWNSSANLRRKWGRPCMACHWAGNLRRDSLVVIVPVVGIFLILVFFAPIVVHLVADVFKWGFVVYIIVFESKRAKAW